MIFSCFTEILFLDVKNGKLIKGEKFIFLFREKRMRNYLKLLLVASIALPISAASAQEMPSAEELEIYSNFIEGRPLLGGPDDLYSNMPVFEADDGDLISHMPMYNSEGSTLYSGAPGPFGLGIDRNPDNNQFVNPDGTLRPLPLRDPEGINPTGMVNDIAGDIVGSVGSDRLEMLGMGLDAINGDGSFMGMETGSLFQGNFNAGGLAGGLVNVAAGNAINNVLNRFTGLGALGGGNYTIGNNGMGNGFSLAIGPQRVQSNRANFLSNIGGGGSGGFGGGLGGLLGDAINGDGTFMGQQTGNLFQGNLNLSNFNAGSALGFNAGGTTSGSTTAASTSTGGGTSGGITQSPVNTAPPSAIGVGPR